MAIQLKSRDDDDEEVVDGLPGVDDAVRIDGSFGFSGDGLNGSDGNSNNGESKFRGGIGDRTVDIDRIKDLPTYTGPTYMGGVQPGVNSSRKKYSIASKVIGIILILGVLFAFYKGISYVVGSSGEDITDKLTLSEEELAKEYDMTFEDNEKIAKMIPHNSYGKLTARSANELDVVYIDGKQVGVHTNGRKYRFFGIGVNDPEYKAIKEMTYQYDSSYMVLNDMAREKSNVYYYYNKKNNDCLVTVVSESTNRIVSLTYYTNFKKISESLSGVDDE